MSREREIVVAVKDERGNHIRTEFIPAGQYVPPQHQGAPMVIKDCEPFLSMADGKTMIGSKSQYRDHLKRHGMQEVGNDSSSSRRAETPPVTPVLRDIYQNRGNPDALRRIAESGKI